MKALIKKIDPPKMSYNGDVLYHRVRFQLEDGSFAMTDIVPKYRNFMWWKEIIRAGAGTWIDGVELKKEGKVNADSQVRIIKAPLFGNETAVQVNLSEVRSMTNPEMKYQIVQTDEGLECSCPAFQFSKNRNCKHIEAIVAQQKSKVQPNLL